VGGPPPTFVILTRWCDQRVRWKNWSVPSNGSGLKDINASLIWQLAVSYICLMLSESSLLKLGEISPFLDLELRGIYPIDLPHPEVDEVEVSAPEMTWTTNTRVALVILNAHPAGRRALTFRLDYLLNRKLFPSLDKCEVLWMLHKLRFQDWKVNERGFLGSKSIIKESCCLSDNLFVVLNSSVPDYSLTSNFIRFLNKKNKKLIVALT